MNKLNDLFVEWSGWAESGIYGQLGQLLLWMILIGISSWLLRKAINRSVIDNVNRYRARKVVRLSAFILILLLAIITFTGNLQYFTITIGLASAGIAFALQEVILSVAGWVSIFSTKMYRTGDRIEINGVKGDVIDIGLTRTTMMEIGEWVNSDNYNGRIVQVSNSQVFKGPIRNYSGDFPFVWDEIVLPIRYGSDLKHAREIILKTGRAFLADYAEYAKVHWEKMVNKYMIEDANVEPTVSLKLTDNWVEFTLRFVVDFKKRRFTKNQIYETLVKAIEDSNGSVSLASATFELTSLPTITIKNQSL